MIALTVDWDFFFEEDPMWDWSHKESLLFLEHAWQWRFEGCPFDLEQVYQPNPLYRTFWKRLRALGFKFNGITLVGDSHLGAWSCFAELPITHIYNFDAHHDVGYSDLGEKVECGNWLGQLLRSKKSLKATVVYPSTERKVKEYFLPESVTTLVGSKVQATSLSTLEKKAREVSYLYICRSGSWTPPWADKQFLDFVSWTKGKPVCFADLLEDVHADLANPLVPRTWNREEALEQKNQVQQFLSGVSAKRQEMG